MAEHSTPIGPSPAAVAPPRGRRPVRVAVAGVLVAAVAGAAYWVLSPSTPPAEVPLPDLASLNEDPDPPTFPANPGYLGPRACAPCHAARVAEFEKTAHARACRRPTDGPMPPGFNPGRNVYLTADPGLRFEMTRQGDDFFQTSIERTPDGERRSTAKIGLAYGAHKADEVFFTWHGDRLYESMTVWLHPTNEWANTPYDRHGGGDFTRETTTRCLECHNTWFAHAPGTANQYRPDSFVLGVTCERCHGPGREHVDFHRAHPKGEGAHAIVQPDTLSRDRLTEVCTQCHANYTKPRGPTLSYRPGQPLAEYYQLAETTYPEQDHVANQVKYLRQSKCFQKSDTLTCVTCHDPHKPHELGQSVDQRSCLKCHQPEACGDRPHLPAEVRDDCVACHMRKQVWMNVHFHTHDDRYFPPIRRYQHRIAIDPVARKEVLLDWHRRQAGEADRREADRLAGELAEYWLKEVDTRHRQFRFLAAIGAAREALRVDPPAPVRARATKALGDEIAVQLKLDDDLITAFREGDGPRPEAAIDQLDRILKIKPDWAAAHAKLGALHARAGRLEQALPHLEVVSKYDPDNATGLALLGWLAYLGDRPADATDFYQRAERIEPFDAKINYHWGLALLRLQRWAEAEAHFRRALEADPDHAGALQGLAHALRQQGRAADAVKPAWRAARITEFREPDVLVTLADAYADAGRRVEAAAAAAKALDVADTGPSRLAFDVRQRLEQLKSRR